MDWDICNEFDEIDTGDLRLDKRCSQTFRKLTDNPNASITQAMCGGRADIDGTYRLFNNSKATWDKILQPHFGKTAKRCAQQEIVLCPQDTTELDFTRPQQQVAGAGPLNGPSRRGAFLHYTAAYTPDGIPLGCLAAEIWTREDPDPDAPKLSDAEKRKIRLNTPIEEKESGRWPRSFHAVKKVASDCPDTTYVSLCDSEGDIFELLIQPRTSNFHWIIRAGQDRVAFDENGDSPGVIRDLLLASPVLFTNQLTVRAREQKVTCETSPRRVTRITRQAMVEVRACAVTLNTPARFRRKIVGRVTPNAVLVREMNPPEGEPPIEWILLTTLPITTAGEVAAIVQYYTMRWKIEVYFRTLKTGCRVEDRRFETIERMLACTALYMVVAWRTLLVCCLGRACPDLDCDAIFDTSEWQSVMAVLYPGKPLPKKPPKLHVMIRHVASLGGYIDRPDRPDPPGVETVWRGIQRTHDLAWAWDTFGPGAKAF